jgi:hypothetical protein
MVVRIVEWRARSFSDPAERLQFLQRKLTHDPAARSTRRRAWMRASLFTSTLGLAVAGVGMIPASRRALGLALPTVLLPAPSATATHVPSPATIEKFKPAAAVPHVWLVETNPQFDLYSNGLRVENKYLTSTQQRSYLAFSWTAAGIRAADSRAEPAGIVYHTTESHLAPFLEEQNHTLKRDGEGLLEYVQRNHSYHFVIDRFGRVFRIVRETDFANHAGNSVWADAAWIYVNLNQSFFGVAFEARSQSEGAAPPVNAAQLHAARTLTEMLRARYGISPANCVTHAQVSVNPDSHRAGYHTDWAANLPFHELGLANNYDRPLPSVILFGFSGAALAEQVSGSPLARALLAAEAQVRTEAAAHNLTEQRYRQILRTRYKDAITTLHARSALQENN